MLIVKRLGVMVLLTLVLGSTAVAGQTAPQAGASKHPLAKEHPITVDATAIIPPKVWSIPGATEPLQSLTALMTNEVKTVYLRPGRHTFTTTSFSFEFTVDLEGKLDYHPNHDQCLGGRGTATLSVKCRFTMPQ